MSARYAILGGLLGAGVVTGIGVFLAVRDLQSPETQARAQAEAQAAAGRVLADTYGLTPARLTQLSQIARGLGAT